MSVIPGIGSKVEHDISQASETHPRYWMLFAERENSPDDDPGDEDPLFGFRSATTASATDAKVYMGILSGSLPSPVHNIAITDMSGGIVIETNKITVNPGIIFNPQSSIPTPVEGHLYYNLSTHQLILRDDTGWSAISAGSVVASLDDLTDVTITTPALNQHLVYTGSIWENQAITLGTGNQILGMNLGATAQEYKTLASNADFINIIHAAGSVTFNDATNPLFTKKSGWDRDARDYIALSFTDGSRTLTVTPSGTYYYWIQGVKYSFSTPQDVIITDTEGLWYIYFVGSTLTASQTPWDNGDDSICFVAYVYWNATANEHIFLGYELHTWVMSVATHAHFHETMGTMYHTGLALTDNANGTLDMSPGSVHDEDNDITIIDSAGSDYFEQDLSPIQIPIYYLDGASADVKKVYNGTSNTYYVYQDGSGNPYWNEFTGGVWTLSSYSSNYYGCYWIIATNDIDEPIIAIMGQGAPHPLTGTAQDNNPIESLNMGSMLQEFKILYRVTVRNIGTPYTTTEIEDFRATSIVPGSGFVADDHGQLAGLLDPDHPQYLRVNGTSPLTANWAVGGFALSDITDLTMTGAIATPTTITTSGVVTIGTINAGVADYNKFLVSDSGIVKFRTGAEVVSDLGVYTTTEVDTAIDTDITTHTGLPDAHHTESHDFDTHTGDVQIVDIGSYAKGRLIFGSLSNWGVISLGTENHVLRAGSDYPEWGQVDYSELSGDAGHWNTVDTEGVITAELVDGQSIDNAIDSLIITHAAIATAHQDAPALIATHADVTGAHHTKYTNSEAVAAIVAENPLSLTNAIKIGGNSIEDSAGAEMIGFNGSGHIDFLGSQGSPSDNDVLAWDTSTSKWIVQAQVGVGGGPGSGTQWKLPVWATTTTLGDSMVSQDSGGTAATVGGSLTVNTVAAGVSDYDKFLVSDSGLVKFRTGTEVLSDIGAAASSHTIVSHSDTTLTGTYLEALLMFGSSNASWIPTIPTGDSFDTTDYSVINRIVGGGTGAFDVYCLIPLPPKKGTLKLFVDDIRFAVLAANLFNYITEIEIHGIKITDGLPILIQRSETNYTDEGAKTWTRSPSDVSGYAYAMVKMECINDTEGSLKFTAPQILCHYST